MNINKDFLKQAGIFLLFLVGFWLISAVYLKPAYDDKVIQQGDMQQARLMRYEADQYKEKYGHNPGWVDGLFSGMPTSLITGIPTGNLVYLSGAAELFHMVKNPINFLFVAMLSMFVMLLAADVNRWLAAAGAIGYAFMTFTITSYEAGHVTKVLAMGVMPGVIGGLLLLAKRRYILGAAVAGAFFALLVGYFHYQIAFYAGIIAGVFVVVEFIRSVKAKDLMHGIKVAGLTAIVLAAGVMANLGKVVDTAQYAEATMRGGSAVASEVPKGGPKKQEVNKKGLERDYAFAWSYGITESYTAFVPRFMGGGTRERIGENELTADTSVTGMYWGDLEFTSGPVYIGAVFIFLFILGIFVVRALKKLRPDNPGNSLASGIMWFSIITTLISFMLAWGRYFPINDLLFEYLPYYNKFRTPMMAFAIAQVTIPFFGLYALHLFINAEFSKEEIRKILKHTLIAVGALLGVGLIILMGADFNGAIDAKLRQRGQGEVLPKLRELRKTEAWMDWLRSLILVGMTLLIVGYTLMQKKSKVALYAGLIILVMFDMIGVSRRYLNEDVDPETGDMVHWQDKQVEEEISPTPKDQQLITLMQKTNDHSRIFDLRYDPFNDAHSVPWHRSIGGYHPAKLSRYQDLISYGITPNGGQLSFDGLMKNNALDMLNCKYILNVGGSREKPEEVVIPRETNLGDAWFVQKVIIASDAKAAIEMINKFKPADEAIVENQEVVKPASQQYNRDSAASIRITQYGLDTIVYSSENSNAGLGVFSEIYYNQKNGSWRAFIDGKEAKVMRVNYILRGVDIPAGKHKIEFVFDFKANRYLGLEMASSGILLALLALSIGMNLFRKTEPEAKDA